ncbi:23S rRNA (uracil-5-)-methyltransferase RumA [Clostridia bacterium]|nr:23S rRNA (uracil-5-)-methyltransferase RumA [Clostridia bacterium]
MNKNDIVTLDVVGYNSEGFGVARVDGLVVFVRGAVRGSGVRARILKVSNTVAWARVEESVSQPRCSYFPLCGGCDLLHFSYDETLYFKRERVRQALLRIGGAEVSEIEVVGADCPFEYRNKAVFPVSRVDGKAVTGFFRSGTHEIVPNTRCAVNRPALDAVAAATREYIDALNVSVYNERTGRGLVRHLFVRETSEGVQAALVINGKTLPKWQEWVARLNVKQALTIENRRHDNVVLGGGEVTALYGEFETSPLAFMQVNPEQTAKLYAKAVEFAALTESDVVADLYCGMGELTARLAAKCSKIYGAEISEEAIFAARRKNIPNAVFSVGDVSAFKADETLDVVCLDPPRSGLGEGAAEAILALAPKRIVYVSCNPETLARDVKRLGYRVTDVCAVDMFPWTKHVECVASLTCAS